MYKNFNCCIVFAQLTPNLKKLFTPYFVFAEVSPARGYFCEAGFLDFWLGDIFRILYQTRLPGAQTQTHIMIFFGTEIQLFSWSFSGSKLKIRSSYPRRGEHSSEKSNKFLLFSEVQFMPSFGVKRMFATYVFHGIDLNLFPCKFNMIKKLGGSNSCLVLTLGSDKFRPPGGSRSGRVFTPVLQFTGVREWN